LLQTGDGKRAQSLLAGPTSLTDIGRFEIPNSVSATGKETPGDFLMDLGVELGPVDLERECFATEVDQGRDRIVRGSRDLAGCNQGGDDRLFVPHLLTSKLPANQFMELGSPPSSWTSFTDRLPISTPMGLIRFASSQRS
jgi:hypothetical protein